MTDKEWQAEECRLLGITEDEHNQLLELCNRFDVAFGRSDTYEFMRRRLFNRFDFDHLVEFSLKQDGLTIS